MNRAQIEVRIAELEAENAAATSWGAAVGARHEEIEGLKRQLPCSAATEHAPTPTQEALAILKWLREPDYAEEFSLMDFTNWVNRRPVAEMCRTVDALVTHTGAPAQGSVLSQVEAEARRYAGMYPQSSDGRNTFVIFADWVASLALSRPQLGGK